MALRADATYEEGELRVVSRAALHELLDMVRGHIDAEDFGTGFDE